MEGDKAPTLIRYSNEMTGTIQQKQKTRRGITDERFLSIAQADQCTASGGEGEVEVKTVKARGQEAPFLNLTGTAEPILY